MHEGSVPLTPHNVQGLTVFESYWMIGDLIWRVGKEKRTNPNFWLE